MIHIYLSGGLGNQMFEYACALRLALQYGDSLCINTIQVDKDPLRRYALGNFKLSKDIMFESKHILFHNPESVLFRIIRKINKEKSWVLGTCFGNYFWKDARRRTFPDKKIKCDIYLDGYWQYEGYFQGIESILRNQFSIKSDMVKNNDYWKMIEELSKNESVCVHVRLGDFEKNSVHSVCTPRYYQEGISYMERCISAPHFYVFSDNVDKAKTLLGEKEKFTYIDSKYTDFESLSIMSFCKHYVISNSSFSWWAQYLSDNPSKIVVAPERWYNTKTDSYELKCKDWVIIRSECMK